MPPYVPSGNFTKAFASPITRALEAAILPVPNDSAGVRILKKMGWRPGQGIGPRISYKQRKHQDLQLGITSEDLDDEEASKHTYAPRDFKVHRPERKANTHGLGYKAALSLNASLGVKDSGPSGPTLAGESKMNSATLHHR